MGEAVRTPEEPLISVIIGVYNGEPYLREAIDSVLAQTGVRLEVIVVDDGSSDESATIAESYGGLVRCIRQENGGIAAARNRALPLAHGRFLAFLDADDRFPPGKLRGQLNVFEADPSLDIVYGHVTEFFSPDLDAAARALLRNPAHDVPWPTTNLMLVRTESFHHVGPFSEHLKVGVTVDWCARAGEMDLRSTIPPILVLERRLHAQNNGIRRHHLKPQYLHVLKASLDRRRQQADSPNDETRR